MFSRAKVLFKLLREDTISAKCRKSTGEKSLTHLFFNENVQELLKKLTNVDFERVFRARPLNKPVGTPEYKFLTTEELNEEMEKIKKKANFLLQMPPVLEPREEINEVLCVDSGLDGFDDHHAKFVFTDTTRNINNEERIVVVREPNGILRKAYWNEKFRVNQIYFPMEGRELRMPKMFEDEHLNNVLDREEYEFILDRACLQFEPDDPVYIKVVSKTYDRISEKSHFNKLLSTRHYGSMTFYLLIHNKIDNLLINIIESDRINDAFALIKLYHIIYPTCQSALQSNKNEQDTLENYIKLDSREKDLLELTLQTYLSKQVEKEKQVEAV